MQTVVLLYDFCCIYEIVILNYFLKYSNKDVTFVSIDGESITAMEGYSINVSSQLADIDVNNVELFVVPGGKIEEIDVSSVYDTLQKVKSNKGLIAGICAGVDVLDHAGILDGIESTHSTDRNVVVTDRVITSRANGYVDFAIEVAKKMNLFKSEDDLKETIAFWREYQRMQ